MLQPLRSAEISSALISINDVSTADVGQFLLGKRRSAIAKAERGRLLYHLEAPFESVRAAKLENSTTTQVHRSSPRCLMWATEKPQGKKRTDGGKGADRSKLG
ncbi:MAG: hypothetical protein R3C01_00670 [Planctomycetaceae bacterium]